MTTKLRKLQWADRDMTELVRDIQQALNKVPDHSYHEISQTLPAGGFIIPVLITKKPIAIEAIRVTNGTDTPINHGTAVSWSWRPNLGGAQVTRVQGMTFGDGVTYVMTFRITYGAS